MQTGAAQMGAVQSDTARAPGKAQQREGRSRGGGADTLAVGTTTTRLASARARERAERDTGAPAEPARAGSMTWHACARRGAGPQRTRKWKSQVHGLHLPDVLDATGVTRVWCAKRRDSYTASSHAKQFFTLCCRALGAHGSRQRPTIGSTCAPAGVEADAGHLSVHGFRPPNPRASVFAVRRSSRSDVWDRRGQMVRPGVCG